MAMAKAPLGIIPKLVASVSAGTSTEKVALEVTARQSIPLSIPRAKPARHARTINTMHITAPQQ